MLKIFTADSFVQLDQVRAIFDANGIRYLHKGESGIGSGIAGGEIPPALLAHELHLFNDADQERATELIEDFLTAQNNREDWVCSDCGEHISKEFSDCWKCASDEVESA